MSWRRAKLAKYQCETGSYMGHTESQVCQGGGRNLPREVEF